MSHNSAFSMSIETIRQFVAEHADSYREKFYITYYNENTRHDYAMTVADMLMDMIDKNVRPNNFYGISLADEVRTAYYDYLNNNYYGATILNESDHDYVCHNRRCHEKTIADTMDHARRFSRVCGHDIETAEFCEEIHSSINEAQAELDRANALDLEDFPTHLYDRIYTLQNILSWVNGKMASADELERIFRMRMA